jgi:hypothetical protein
VNWIRQDSGISANLSGITFGNQRFVAVGSMGAIVVSTNAIDWTNRSVPATNTLTAVAHGNGNFVAIGFYTAYSFGFPRAIPIVWTSNNGTIWTNSPSISFVAQDVTFGNDLFVALGVDAAIKISTSRDGVNWTSANWPGYDLYCVTAGRGMFVAAGQNIIDDGTQIATSFDGRNWTKRNTGFSSCYGICFGNGGFVGVGGSFTPGGLGSTFLTSSDGVAWTTRGASKETISSSAPIFLRSVAFGSGAFIAVGDAGTIYQSVPTPMFLAGQTSNETFRVAVTADIGLQIRLRTSSDLNSSGWTDWLTFTNSAVTTYFIDTMTGQQPRRFYQAVSP